MISNMLNLSESIELPGPAAAIIPNAHAGTGNFTHGFSSLIPVEAANIAPDAIAPEAIDQPQSGGIELPEIGVGKLPDGKTLPPDARPEDTVESLAAGELVPATASQPSPHNMPADEPLHPTRESAPKAGHLQPIMPHAQLIANQDFETALSNQQPSIAKLLAELPKQAAIVVSGQGAVAKKPNEARDRAAASSPILQATAKASTEPAPTPFVTLSREPLLPMVQSATADTVLQQSPPSTAPQMGNTVSLQTFGVSQSPQHQLDTLIDNLVDARESGRSARGDMLMRHAEFGSIAVRVDQADGDLHAKLSSRDPAFAAAAQAALNERVATTATSDTSTNHQRGQDQSGFAGQSRDGAMGESGNRSSDQRGSRAESAPKASDHPIQTEQELENSRSGHPLASRHGRFA